jgi:glycosyltransferase involved in cell wall biosynthesis
VIMPNGVEPWLAGSEGAGDQILIRFPAVRGWKRTILFFSRMHPKKGVDLLVEAFERLHPYFPDAGLLIAAIAQDKNYGDAIREKIAEYKTANIVLVNEPDGLKAEDVFAIADIFCLPSHQEGFSQAILEAAAASLPELITDKCHIPEIEEFGAGFVVPDTVDGIEGGLRALLAMDDKALSVMGQNGKRLVDGSYTWDRIAQRLIDAYQNAISKRGLQQV